MWPLTFKFPSPWLCIFLGKLDEVDYLRATGKLTGLKTVKNLIRFIFRCCLLKRFSIPQLGYTCNHLKNTYTWISYLLVFNCPWSKILKIVPVDSHVKPMSLNDWVTFHACHMTIYVCMYECVWDQLCPTHVTPWTIAHQAPLPRFEPESPALAGRFLTTSTTWEAWPIIDNL